MKKVIGTESGGKSAYERDGKYYDTTGNSHLTEKDANVHIEAEIFRKENLGINTITGIDGIIILLVCLILFGSGVIGIQMFSQGSPFKGICLISLPILTVYPLYRFFFRTFSSTRNVVYVFVAALGLLINWILAKYFDIHLL
ncbi:hypothetical protein FOM00_24965 [Pseudomonas sp. ST1]|uniref:hypothetical protein n=1 Tax=Pseudomonas TaxID=286 RepID=UPI0006B9807A|nr:MULTISPECIES: hypothetical protein [Pseudomonas]RML98083.1 hypothetical protein ALQ88_02576 [Pseudomonas savastanoi]TSC33323.1 hypothetical protein FOM00_24965 [Pseudomonas sp. ST1]